MKIKEKNPWDYRYKFVIGGMVIIFAVFVQLAYSHKPEAPVILLCDEASASIPEAVTSLPDTHYLYSERYGWFDQSHFDTGQPAKVLADVSTAVARGGDVITISQGVRDNITGYTATYFVSGRLNEADVRATALGIYLDWSLRFEAWQAEPPHGLAGPLTSFAIEDLPSQYLGFYAQAHGISISQLFACYLGPVTGTEEGPPNFARIEETVDGTSWAGVTRLQNKWFTPMIKNQDGWQQGNWPTALEMSPIASSTDTWQFLSESTWYLGDTEQSTTRDFLKTYALHHLPR